MPKLRLFWSSIWKLIWQFWKRSTAPLNLAALDGRFPLTNPEARVHFVSFEHNPSEDQNLLKASSSTPSIHSFWPKSQRMYNAQYDVIGHRVIAISGARVGTLTFSEVAINKGMQSAISGFAAGNIANFVYSWPMLLTQSLQSSVMLPYPLAIYGGLRNTVAIDQLVGAVMPNTTGIKEQHQLILWQSSLLTSQADTQILNCSEDT